MKHELLLTLCMLLFMSFPSSSSEITRDSASEVDMYSDEEIDRSGGRGYGRGRRSGSLARQRRGYNSRDRGQSRIFVALFDYDPPTMSPNPEACEEELPFREGQLIKVINVHYGIL